MKHPIFSLSALSAKDIARVCRVDEATARRWRRRASCPPPAALILLELVYTADLGALDPDWAGWVLRRGKLCSPENWICTPGEIRALQLLNAQLSTYQSENRRLRQELKDAQMDTFEEQPLPSQWDLKIG
jgi:hypothetical protein